MAELAGKAALVTGGSRGLGAATAPILAEMGAAVTLVARGVEGCRGLAAEVSAGGGWALALACDVADDASVEAAVAATCETFGGLDILINNAGVIEPEARIEEGGPAAWADLAGRELEIHDQELRRRAGLPD